MAANGETQQEMKAHVSTYSGFLSLMKYGAVASFIVVAVVVFLLAR